MKIKHIYLEKLTTNDMFSVYGGATCWCLQGKRAWVSCPSYGDCVNFCIPFGGIESFGMAEGMPPATI